MRKGGLLFREALVEDPLEEMMAGMVMAQYGMCLSFTWVWTTPLCSPLLSFYAITPRDGLSNLGSVVNCIPR
jgi:hypothetical protein